MYIGGLHNFVVVLYSTSQGIELWFTFSRQDLISTTTNVPLKKIFKNVADTFR